MNKRLVLIGGVFIAAAGIALMPNYFGSQIENQYQKMAQALSDAPGVKAELVRYDKGWSASEAVLRVDIRNPEILDIVYKIMGNTHDDVAVIEITQGLKHGPLVKDSSGGWHTAMAALSAQSVSLNGQTVDMDLAGLVQWGGDAHWDLQLPAVNVDGIQVSPSTSKWNLDNSFSHLQVEQHYPQLTWQDGHSQIVAQNAVWTADIPIGEENWQWLFNQALEVEKLQANGEQMELSQLAFAQESWKQEAAEQLESKLSISFKDLVIDGEHSGPLLLTGNMRNISLTALNTLKRRAKSFELMMQWEQMLLRPDETMSSFLAARPELSISEFTLVLPEGVIDASLDLAIGGSIMDSAPENFLNSFSVQADVRAPKTFFYHVIKAQERINLSIMLEQQGRILTQEEFEAELEKSTVATVYQMEFEKMLLSEGADDYRIGVSLLNGVVNLNGSPAFSFAF